jgi:hypothetical protein
MALYISSSTNSDQQLLSGPKYIGRFPLRLVAITRLTLQKEFFSKYVYAGLLSLVILIKGIL